MILSRRPRSCVQRTRQCTQITPCPPKYGITSLLAGQFSGLRYLIACSVALEKKNWSLNTMGLLYRPGFHLAEDKIIQIPR